MQEVWKEIEGTNGMYQVSNLGNVKSFTRIKKGGLLKPGRYSNGYLFVHFAKDTDKKGERHSYLIHRLVAQAFLPNPDGLPQVNHKDENKTNNRVDNLEWCTHLYNQNYGTKNQRIGEKNKISNGKPVYCIELDRVFVRQQRRLGLSAETQQMYLLFAEEKKRAVPDIIGNMLNNTPDTENRNVFGIFC